MKKSIDVKKEIFVYFFSDIQHFKRINNFLQRKKIFVKKLMIFFNGKNKNLDEILSKINLINSSLKLSYANFTKNNFCEFSKSISNNENVSLIIDKFMNEGDYRICNQFLKNQNFKIIFIEHNLNYHWDHIFTYRSGYKKKNLINLIFSANTYRVIIWTFFSKLRFRFFDRKVKISELMKFGILNFSDEIYLYSKQSFKFVQNIKSIANIEKSIIKYDYEFLPKKPALLNVLNICIFSFGSFKSKNKKIINLQKEALKKIIFFLKKKFSTINIQITIKFKQGEMDNFLNMKSEFGKDLIFLDNIDDQREHFHLVVVPIDSFVLIEYLRSDVPIYTYNIYKNYGPIGNLATKTQKIPLDFSS